VFNAKEKGFEDVVKRAGRSVLIDERAFFEWVEEQNALSQLGEPGEEPPGGRTLAEEDADWRNLLKARDDLERQIESLGRGGPAGG
tara:strand:+ start:250 stop:507 length:258 start_codon:yes stop_codon:yes gene_type:complete